MKKLVLLFCFVLSLSVVTFGQTLLLNDNCDYGMNPNSDMTLCTQNWARHSGTQGPQYVYPGLSFTGYPSSNIGGAISFTSGSSGTNDGDINRTFTDVITTSTVYVSFLVNLSSAKAATDYFFHLGLNPISTSIYRGKVFSIASGAGWNIGVSKMATSTPTMNTTVLNFNQTYLIVIKYNFSVTTADDDKVSLYVYQGSVPSLETSQALVAISDVNDGASDPTDIGSVMVRQSSNCPTGLIDGIRVSDNWGLAVTGTATSVEENNSLLPTKFELSQNYPNPFNPSTSIKYQVPQNSFVSINVYDVLGNVVRTLVREEKAAGSYELRFDASNMPSGVYFYKIQAGNFTQTKKMILMK